MGWMNGPHIVYLSRCTSLGLLVVPERDEAAVPEVSVLGPFDKLKLPDELRFQPPVITENSGRPTWLEAKPRRRLKQPVEECAIGSTCGK